jgi:hypothetical protein
MAGKLLMALIAGIFGRTLRSARRTPPARQEPLVLSRGDCEATRVVGLVGLVGRVPGCHVTQRPVLARTRALQMA